jgi:hypothetical protein
MPKEVEAMRTSMEGRLSALEKALADPTQHGSLESHILELARIATESGWPEPDVRAMLASDAMRQVVADECRESADVGIQGVPFFIFNGRTAVSGAHDPPMLLEAIAAARRGD